MSPQPVKPSTSTWISKTGTHGRRDILAAFEIRDSLLRLVEISIGIIMSAHSGCRKIAPVLGIGGDGNMDQSIDRDREVFALVREALSFEGEWEHFLNERSDLTPALRSEVAALLAEIDTSRAFFTHALPEQLSHLTDGEDPERIGPYEIIEKLGQGGMGVVYLAQQQDPDRKVAVKLLKAEMAGSHMLRRFRDEIHILSRLDHQHIARVHEAGLTSEGRPYMVMPYIDGCSITTYCRDKNLAVAQRLELFSQVCSAIHHAHLRGVIHRDLKPANILVETIDGKPVTRVIDFGIARFEERSVLRPRPMTQTASAALLGSLGYMSPEQAMGRRDEIDVRTDIYALGIVLCELLSGINPFHHKPSEPDSLEEILRKIREWTPPRPSVLWRTSHGEERVPIPADLDWIVMKCLEKDKDRRYDSVSLLLEDIERWLRGEPVSAHPPSRRYRLTRLVKRHKALALTTVGVFTSLIVAVLGTSYGLLQAKHEARQTEATLSVMEELLSSVNPLKHGKDVLLRDLLDEFGVGLSANEDREPAVMARLHKILASTYLNIGLYEKGEQRAREALRFYEQLDDPENFMLTRRYITLGLYHMGKYTEAEAMCHESLDLLKSMPHDDALAARIMCTLAMILQNSGNLDSAYAWIEKAYARHPTDIEVDGELINLMITRSAILCDRDRHEEGRAQMMETKDLAEKHLSQKHQYHISITNQLATCYNDTGQYEEAEQLHRANLERCTNLLGEDHPRTVTSTNNVLVSLMYQEKYAEAAVMQEEQYKRTQRTFGERHPNSLTAANNLAACRLKTDNADGAISLLRANIVLGDEVLGKTHPVVMLSRQSLGVALSGTGSHEEAEALLRFVYEGRMAKFGEQHGRTLATGLALARARLVAGNAAASHQLLQRLIPLALESFGEQHPYYIRMREILAEAEEHL